MKKNIFYGGFCMLKYQSFAVIGGDQRQISMMRSLAGKGFLLTAAGFEGAQLIPDSVRLCHSAADAMETADGIILPLPVTRDNKTIAAPFAKTPMPLAETIQMIRSDQVVFGGMLTETVRSVKGFERLTSYDYFEREELAVRNAIPTAEGAIAIAMQHLGITLNSARCLITGYGRIGKLVAKLLKGFGSDVTVCVRSKSDEAWLQAAGIRCISYEDLSSGEGGFDVVFNTVPTAVFHKRELQTLGPQTVFIDLASNPGGVDCEEAQQAGISVIRALSLPAKVAPVTAGEIISDTILNIVKEG